MSNREVVRKRVPRRLNGYSGPYPYQMLNDARYTLMKSVDMKDTVIWSRIRSKTGIYDNGERDAVWNGFGEQSTYYSHADLIEENPMEGEYHPRVSPTSSTVPVASETVTTASLKSGSPESSSEIHAQFTESPEGFKFQFYDDNKSNDLKTNVEIEQDLNAEVKSDTSDDNVRKVKGKASDIDVKRLNEKSELGKDLLKDELKHIVKSSSSNENVNIVRKKSYGKQKLEKVLPSRECIILDSPEEGEIIDSDDGEVVDITDDTEYESTKGTSLSLNPFTSKSFIADGEVVDIADDTEYEATKCTSLSLNPVTTKRFIADNNDPVIVISDETLTSTDETPTTTDAHNYKRKRSCDHMKPIVIDEDECYDTGDNDSVIIVDNPEETRTPSLKDCPQPQKGLVDNIPCAGQTIKKQDCPQPEKGLVDNIACAGQTIKKHEKHSGNKQFIGSSDQTSSDNGSRVRTFMYKCDFCDEICQTLLKMKKHLTKSVHFSASKISIDKDPGDYVIEEKLAVMMKRNLFKTTVAVCPNPVCNKMFQTTYACALHHRIHHDSAGQLSYGLADVLETEQFTNPLFSCQCPVCGEIKTFTNTTKQQRPRKRMRVLNERLIGWLCRHYKQNSHYPFNYEKGDCRFLCSDCDKSFEDNLYEALRHQTQHQKIPYTHDMNLTLIQTGEVRVQELPQMDHDLIKDASLKEIRRNEIKVVRAKYAFDKNSNGSLSTTGNQSIDVESNESMNGPEEEPIGDFFTIDRKPSEVEDQLVTHQLSNNSASNEVEGELVTHQLSNSSAYNEVKGELVTHPLSNSSAGKSSGDIETDSINTATGNPMLENNINLAGKYMFLCDYCKVLDIDRNSIYQHLIKDCHSSASIVQVDSNGIPATLFEQRSVKNYRGAYKKLVAACPIEGCHIIFPDIYQCNMHCKIFHQCSDNIYGVSQVKMLLELEIPENLTCNICKATFSDKHTFLKHLDEENHHEQGHDVLVPTENIYIHFVCSYCETIMSTRFVAVLHLRKAHPLRSISAKYRIKVIHSDKIVSKIRMLPNSSDIAAETRNIESSLAVIKEMNRSGKKKRKLREEKIKLNSIKHRLRKKQE